MTPTQQTPTQQTPTQQTPTPQTTSTSGTTPSAGLLIRLWLEPGDATDTSLRARLLSVHGTDVGDQVTSAGDEAAVADAVQSWLRREYSVLRGLAAGPATSPDAGPPADAPQ